MQEKREVLEWIISGIGLLLDLSTASSAKNPERRGKRTILH